MKLIDGITAFFTTIFDGVFAFFGVVKKGFEYVVNNRAAMVSAIVVTVKSVYDFVVVQLDKALEKFGAISSDLTNLSDTGGVGGFLAFGNTIFPLSETLAVAVMLFELWLACMVVKLILKFVPGV